MVHGLSHEVKGRADDLVQPFQIEASRLRGRQVRLGALLDEILTRHSYPEPVIQLLGELVVLGVLLASALKYQGVFTLQIKGDGALPMMVVDVTAGGDVRGYAKFDGERLAATTAAADVPGLIGHGYLAFTVDQGPDTERYQGIVSLEGASLAECVQHYFRQSEQLEAGLKVAVGRMPDGRWRGGALMVQRFPDPSRQPTPSDREDDWRRAMILMDSAGPAELLDPALPPEALLYRLFHEDGVRVFRPVALQARCRCSRQRVVDTLHALPRDELESLKVDGALEVACEFCGTNYVFDDEALAAVYAS